jgi:hypothetical protein
MTDSAFPLLEALRAALAVVPGVATCSIELEANMTPADYPMVRIVPSRLSEAGVIGWRGVDCLIYFGRPIHEFSSGMESEWQELLAMEAALLQAMLQHGGSTYSETILDEDRIDAYKLLAIRCRVEG